MLFESTGKLGEGTPAEIATFLRTAPNLNKTVVGDYLGEREDESLKVMRAYVDAMDFSGFGLDDAIQKVLRKALGYPVSHRKSTD